MTLWQVLLQTKYLSYYGPHKKIKRAEYYLSH